MFLLSSNWDVYDGIAVPAAYKSPISIHTVVVEGGKVE
jgi:hypothetical protein